MFVKAKARGYYGDKIREEGEVFELVERKDKDDKPITAKAQFSKLWMVEVKRPKVEVEAKADAE